MSNQHFGLQDDPFADAHELTVEEATQLLRGRITAAGGEGTRLFPDETCVELHRLSSGRRGGIFALAGRAMKIAARAGAMRIEPTHVQTGASEAGHDAARAVARAAESVPPSPTGFASDADGGVGMMLPNEPSPELDPEAREWVGRFMSTPGPGFGFAASREPVRETMNPPVEEPPQPAAEPRAEDASPPRPAAEPRPKPAGEPRPKPAAELPPKPAAQLTPKPAAEARSKPAAPVAKQAVEESPEPQPQEPPPPPATQLSAATSARLREGPRSRTRRQRALVQGAVAAVAVIALLIVVMNRLPARPTAPAARIPAATMAPGPTAGPAVPPAASPTTAKPEATVPAPVPSASPATESAEGERVGLEVATYIFRERAEDERARLVAAGYRARVKTAWENGSPSYRVIVGPYRGWPAAERAADELLATGMVGQARAIKLD